MKLESNDAIRQRFIDRTVPQADFIGLNIPDKDMKFNEATGHYEHGTINWNEFFDVIIGNGPCNAERLKARIDADKKGQWVREAATAYAAKQVKEKQVA